MKTLTELRQWNLKHEKAGAIKYGQSNLDNSDEMDVEMDRARYEADRAKDIALAATHGIDEVMKANRLDALLFPGSSGAAIAAKPGYPTVIVPFAMVPNAPFPPFPEAFDAKPGPFGVSFTGMACSEPRLIELGYAFERATVFNYLNLLAEPHMDGPRGLLTDLPVRVRTGKTAKEVQDDVTRICGDLLPRIDETRTLAIALFDRIAAFLANRPQNETDTRLRITQNVRNNSGWTEVEIAWDDLSLALCRNQAPHDVHGVPVAGDQSTTLALRRGGDVPAWTLDPWPFAGDVLLVQAEGRRLTGTYGDDAELHAVLRRAPLVRVVLELRPARG